ncbi:hypothetical protein EE612_050470 [Oryza sativa]|nr:hypothetical protein EE612_050470 [Oryza sativa]
MVMRKHLSMVAF